MTLDDLGFEDVEYDFGDRKILGARYSVSL